MSSVITLDSALQTKKLKLDELEEWTHSTVCLGKVCRGKVVGDFMYIEDQGHPFGDFRYIEKY
jgi:hypothetical protein